MSATSQQTLNPAFAAVESAPTAIPANCFHCGEPCSDAVLARAGKNFCCTGCRTVHDLLAESGLTQFYDLTEHPGAKVRSRAAAAWAYLDEPLVSEKLLDFADENLAKITLEIPAIHCVACVWLLENLFRLHPGVGASQVNFTRREVSISYTPKKIKLSELVALLDSLGYTPHLTLGELERRPVDHTRRRLWLQMGIAGFGFGNIMLISLPGYLGLDSFSGPMFQKVFGWLSLLLALPVVLYSAGDYWRAARTSIRQRIMTLDVPIALGLAALYLQSAWEIFSHTGEGYLDSLAGLVFFLLCGRIFQQRTQDRISFERDYRNFFPLSATRVTGTGEESVAISQLVVGDRLRIRNGELIPADSRLLSASALIDYSFVSGESEPVLKQAGAHLYAGGKQAGSAIEVEILRPVSQSYLTSLWNNDAFKKDKHSWLYSITNRFSRWFTRIVVVLALSVAGYWALTSSVGAGLKAFTAILIVACPCALALSAPFTLGTAQRLLARFNVFLRKVQVLETMAHVDTIVFDKTGTLTMAEAPNTSFHPANRLGDLNPEEARLVAALARQSTHPYSVRIVRHLAVRNASGAVENVRETPGAGLAGTVNGHAVAIGSFAWLKASGVVLDHPPGIAGGLTALSIDGVHRGTFVLATRMREEADRLLLELGHRYELALLSGDNARERELFQAWFGGEARLHFNQSPQEKLQFIESLQRQGRIVMMVGDGLNDAGALRQSDVGVAVVERTGAFSPASDVIMEADSVGQLGRLLAFSKKSVRIIHLSFAVSALYNLIGISIAAMGVLSPLIAAVLMPLSSVSVVLFACGLTTWAAKSLKLYRA